MRKQFQIFLTIIKLKYFQFVRLQLFDDYFKYLSLQHHHITRSISNKNLYLQRMKTHRGLTFFSYNGIKIWNKITINIKLLSKYSFNRCIKLMLINKY